VPLENNNYSEFGERGPNYWKQLDAQGLPRPFGFGYGAWWATQYPWARRYFPFMRWFPFIRWRPFYKIDEADISDYLYGAVIPAEVIDIDATNFPVALLPALPTFASYGINMSILVCLQKPTHRLRVRDRQAIIAVVRQIQIALDSLRVDAARYIAAGYWPVPDLDRQIFTWVRDPSKAGILQPIALRSVNKGLL
jgi:hypothetical protein